MSVMASQITWVSIVYSTVCSGADRRKHQSSASLAFVRGILRWPMNSPNKKASNAENVSIWWHYHEVTLWLTIQTQINFPIQDEPKLKDLLSPKNINQETLIAYVREATNIATDGKMKSREFAVNHHAKPDVALFNFTAFHKAQNSCMGAERHGRKLLLSVIGDALMEVCLHLMVHSV